MFTCSASERSRGRRDKARERRFPNPRCWIDFRLQGGEWACNNVKKSREQFLGRDERGELEVARTEDSFVFDAKRKRYIDFMMGWCVGNFGWGNAVLAKEAKNYRGPDYIYPGYSYAPWEELAQLLISIAPSGLTKAFRATGGSEAVDLALQAAIERASAGENRGATKKA